MNKQHVVKPSIWIWLLTLSVALGGTASAGELLFHWDFQSVEERIAADVTGRGPSAELLRADYNQPYPEWIAANVGVETTGAIDLQQGGAVRSLEAFELPASWTLSFWIKDGRARTDIPGELALNDILAFHPRPLALSEPWYFRPDPDAKGRDQQWYGDAPDDAWQRMVVPAFWSETDVGSYLGYGWYQTRFFVPEAYADQPHELHFAGVDEQGWIYVNGQLVGEQSTESTGRTIDQIWDKPFTVTIAPEHLRGGAYNQLAVLVHASAGNAGLFRPAFFIPPEAEQRLVDFGALNVARHTPGQWEKVALRFADGELTVFVNGVAARTNRVDEWSRDDLRVALELRADRASFRGLLDDVRFFDAALSDEQLAALAGDVYHPQAEWLATFDETMQALIRDNILSREQADHFVELGAPDEAALIHTFKTHADLDARLAAVWALGQLGEYDALALMIESLDTSEPTLFAALNQALEQAHQKGRFPRLLRDRADAEAVALLGKALRHLTSSPLRYQVIGALTSAGDQAAAADLLAVAEDGRESLVLRSAALEALQALDVEVDITMPISPTDWPMWRYDAARSADTPLVLNDELHLQWVRELPAPQRAWPFQWDDRGKLDFDVSYAPVVLGARIFVPSNVSDSLAAYSIEDGAEEWRFYTDGPVRLAPVAWGDRVYFASDDGHLYCVDVETGELDWSFRAGPTDQRFLGNERIINFWAVRGGPVITENTVYFAAGIWPLHGVFIYALDAQSGEVVWVNDTTSSDYVRLPHGGARGYGGLSPQGYLAVDDNQLVVSPGRGQEPMRLDRRTGAVIEYSFRGRKGGGGYAVHAGGLGFQENAMIQDRLKALEDSIDGEVFYSLAARDRLFVVTEDGRIYCFGPEPVDPVVHAFVPEPVTPRTDAWHAVARQALKNLGESEGYALLLGAGSGDLLRELLVQSELRVVVVESDADTVRALRTELAAADLYGRRAAVIAAEPALFAVNPCLFSLVLSEDAQSAGLTTPQALAHALERLRPYGGIAHLGNVRVRNRALQAHAVDAVEARIRNRTLEARRHGPLPGAGQWTHQYRDPTHNIMSPEHRVRLPVGILWFGGPNNHDILPRHSGGPRPQVVGGRIFYLGVDSAGARCVYTGRILWSQAFPGIGYHATNMELEERWRGGREVYMTNIPGATYVGSPIVSLPDAVYIRYEGAIHKLDPATGEIQAVFELPGRHPRDIYDDPEAIDWGHIHAQGDALVLTTEPHLFEDQRIGWTGSYTATSSRRLAVLNRHTGELVWEREAAIGFRHNAIISHGDTLYLIDGLSENALEQRARRGRRPDRSSTIMALDLATGEERWGHDSDVFGTFLMYVADHDMLIEGGSVDLRRPLEDEPRHLAARCGATGEIVWTGGNFVLPGAVHGEKLIPGRPGHAISVLTGERWHRVQPLTGETTTWQYRRAYGCNTLSASPYLLFFRSGYASYFDLANDTGTGNFSGFRSGCTANMVAADGVISALDYSRTCTCSYALQTSLAMIHMPDDPHIEQWTRYDAAPPDPSRHGLNFGAPGRRVDAAGRVWFDQEGHYHRHSTAIRDANGSIPWVLSSIYEGEGRWEFEDLLDTEYLVRLHFAELRPDVAAGQRVFDVWVDGEKALAAVDIAAQVGGSFTGLVHDLRVPVTGHALTIELKSAAGSTLPPIINGIEFQAQIDHARQRQE